MVANTTTPTAIQVINIHHKSPTKTTIALLVQVLLMLQRIIPNTMIILPIINMAAIRIILVLLLDMTINQAVVDIVVAAVDMIAGHHHKTLTTLVLLLLGNHPMIDTMTIIIIIINIEIGVVVVAATIITTTITNVPVKMHLPMMLAVTEDVVVDLLG